MIINNLDHVTCVVCLTLTVMVLELALICNLPSHLEPALTYMYKGEVCTCKFVFIRAKGYVKVRRVYMPPITAGRINRGRVDINHLLMRFHHQVNSICGVL